MHISIFVLMSELEDSIDIIKELKEQDQNSPDFISWKKDTSVLLGLLCESQKICLKNFWEIKYYPPTAKASKEEKYEFYKHGLEKAEVFLKDLFKKLKEKHKDYEKIEKKIVISDNFLDTMIKNWKLIFGIIFFFFFFIIYFLPYILENNLII